MAHVPLSELEAGLDEIRASPSDAGVVELIARRPAGEERELLEEGQLDPVEGMVGDHWLSKQGAAAGTDTQLTVMNARAAALIAGPRSRWAIAGDQLYVDLDLRHDNLPPGTRLSLGAAVIEVTAVPHTGCGKFLRRFGFDAQKFVNSAAGRELNIRGINARVVTGGIVRRGDPISKQPAVSEATAA
jgi:MOSC domain-containing protein YiiM